MRALNVSVRLAATVMAVAAAAGCMSVGDEGRKPGPSPSAGQRGGEKPDGGSAVTGGGGTGYQSGQGKRRGSASPGPSASRSASAAPAASGAAEPSGKATPPKGGTDEGNGEWPEQPEPTKGEPTPPPTVEPQPEPEPSKPVEPPSPEPSAEPSSSAHEQGAQLVEREPAPRAGDAA
ncbi:hypothetical protein ACSCB1_43185 [Streptomyces europaeiscabiei]|uniref:Lipoprotein n=1 Tax=Streptomyces europaeiscabiei TaxID=146819 RepID=A0ABU4NV42_9ACTN|nr:hypothetical protein [Streptomyces europaeiscabiei]MDX2531027.1 hypothetical protein [Streptomyces europaeiscabiei]MDX2765536.1 hypothetical protein [Streptomyces europaeiscabiei]MDX2774839.1 hypothetical protein [Streptomyces europaeiscabiei]MDX3549442.1 hypothetical protein [Streptomyces europaeiscabiei]MDX3558534.1 hypothetical protein [Streptomyces europaeiscabiei]